MRGTDSQTYKTDPTARTEMPVQPPGEVERRELAEARDKNQRPVMPPHTAAEVEMSEYMDRDEIAKLAYHHWLARQNGGWGSPEDDWFRAEQELRGRPAGRHA